MKKIKNKLKSLRRKPPVKLPGKEKNKFVILGIFVASFAALGVYLLVSSEAAGTPLSMTQCLARPTNQITRFTGTKTGRYDTDGVFDRTFDLRGSVQRDTPVPTLYANTLNIHPDSGSGARNCWIGGAIFGNIPWNIGWQDWYAQQGSTYDGDGLEIGTKQDWDVIDGFRVDNVADAIMPMGEPPAEVVARNLYFTNIRDDCVEMDTHPKTLTITDSYMECYTGISEMPGDGDNWPQPGGTTTILDHLLLWEKPMISTGCRNTAACADGNGTAEVFKQDGQQTSTYIVKDSIFRVDEPSEWSATETAFPTSIQFQNSTLVWTGQSKWGNFPGGARPGLTITNDVSVWNNAAADWLARHGCPAGGDTTGVSCTKLINPDPPGGSTPPPPGDTTAPVVQITSPANNSTISGNANVAASATDNVAVTKVEFYVDGTLKTSDSSSPFGYTLDTTTLSNTSHNMAAKAFDAAGNTTTSATVTVTVSNVSQPPPPPGSTTKSGYQNTSGSYDSGNNNLISATQITSGTSNGTLNSVSLNIGSVTAAPSNHGQAAIYSDINGNPGTLLGSSSSQILIANSWNTFPISSVSISPNTKYWLAFNLDGSTTQFAFANVAGTSAFKNPTTFGTWPSSFGTPNFTTAQAYAIYMTYSAAQSTIYAVEDINQDGKIDILDFSLLSSKFGATTNLGRADINQDGRVNILDFSLLAAKFGS